MRESRTARGGGQGSVKWKMASEIGNATTEQRSAIRIGDSLSNGSIAQDLQGNSMSGVKVKR